MPRSFSAFQLASIVGTERAPIVVDVRRQAAYLASTKRIVGSLWRDHMKTASWISDLRDGAPVVVYCAHGHNVSELAAAKLAEVGVDVFVLDGGIEAYEKAGGVMVKRDAMGVDVAAGASVWVTRERPKIDRVACPWLIRRFIDPLAIFHFVATTWVRDVAEELGAIPFDVEGVHYSHRGDECSFDAIIAEFGLSDPALLHLARIVRAADTGRLDQEPQAAGLLAISLGLSATEDGDLGQFEKGMALYDALYGWCRLATGETHNWPVGLS